MLSQPIQNIHNKPFSLTENASPGVARAEKKFLEDLKNGVTDEAKTAGLSGQMILGKMEEWIKLLVATLKDQDPTNPADHKDMINQFGTFAQTMGISEIKTYLENLTKIMGTTQVIEAAQQLDKLATIESSKFMHLSGQPNGVGFDMPGGAYTASIFISDNSGRTVSVISKDCGAGHNEFLWDGKDQDGKEVSEGVYKIDVVALDADGKQMKAIDGSPHEIKTYVKGIITGSSMGGSGATIKINRTPMEYPVSALRGFDLLSVQEVKTNQEKQSSESIDKQGAENGI